jgi:epoxyqueuosine reductase
VNGVGDPASLRRSVEELATALGFDRVGVASPEPGDDTRFLSTWLERGYAGDMHYLGRRAAEREDPRRLMEGLKSIICVGLVYDRQEPANRDEPDPPHGKIARYAGGDDYHDLMKGALRALGDGLEALVQRPFGWRVYVDTGPLLERTLAARAGLGWIGRNTCLIDPKLGSYLFLGCLLTDLELAPDAPLLDHCGSCRACLDACPTNAFPEPYVMDARACISYQTIEQREAIPETLREAHGSWVFGCDICQEVCPWNRRRRRRIPDDRGGLRERLRPRDEWRCPSLRWILSLDEAAWRGVTRKTALRRSKWRGLMRNALIAAGNSGEVTLRDAVAAHAESEDALVAEHARWALARLAPAPSATRE